MLELQIVDSYQHSSLAVKVLSSLEISISNGSHITHFKVNLGDSKFEKGLWLGHPAYLLQQTWPFPCTTSNYLYEIYFLLEMLKHLM